MSLEQRGAVMLSGGSSVVSNANGAEIGNFNFLITTLSSTEDNNPVRSKALLFQAGGKLIMVQLATPEQLGEELLRVMDQILDSIHLIEP